MTALFRRFIGAVLAIVFSAVCPVSVFAQPSASAVALLAADANLAAEDVRIHLIAAGYDVTIIDVSAGTPSLADLAPYQTVFTWSFAPEYPYADGAALGDVLADFVDSGRGVVQAGFSLFSTPFGLAGRWRLERYGALSDGGFNLDSAAALRATLPKHSILAGVNAFHGGNAVANMSVAAQGCAEIVARWNNNRPLIAAGAGPRAGRVVALNFHPVSDAFYPQYWRTNPAYDGARLLANAVGYAAGSRSHAAAPSVALVASDAAARVGDVQCKLHNLEMFSRVDAFNAQSSTPDSAALRDYDAVLTWTSASYRDATALGNVLAEFVDTRHGVVHSPVSFSPGAKLSGRWLTEDYRPIIESDPAAESDLTLIPVDASHPVLSGVTSVRGGASSYHTISVLNSIPGDPPLEVVATWSNGQPLIVLKKKASGGRVISLNMFPPSSDALADSWDRNTDGARLLANTLLFAANHAPTVDVGGDLRIEANAVGVAVMLTAAASDADGDELTFTWSGAVSPTAGETVTFTAAPPPSSQPSHTYVVVLTVTDGKGGSTINVVNIVVEDTDGPAMQGLPSAGVTLPATNAAGAWFTFGPMTSVDAVDGVVPVSCSHGSGTFPIGDTVVTCTSSDSRGNTSSSSFTVSVTATETVISGKVSGFGFIRDDDLNYEFAFAATEKAGVERAGLLLAVKSGYCGRHRHNRRHSDNFVSTTAESVVFDGDHSVLATGAGRWNGRPGYRYEVSASDTAVRRRHYDTVRITVKSSTGAVVAHVDGRLSGGNIQFVRVP